MKQIVKWGVPAHISGRVYHRGCIKLPNLDEPVDVMLLNYLNDKEKIGEAYLVENEEGIFVKEVNWYINIDYLDNLIEEYREKFIDTHSFQMESMRKKGEEWKYDSGPTIALMGIDRLEYSEVDSIEFSFVTKQILSEEPIGILIRDIRVNTIVS